MLINYDLKAIFFHNVKCGGNFCMNLLRMYGFIPICLDDHVNYIDFVDDESYIQDIKDKHTIRKLGKYRYYYLHQHCNKEYMDNYFKFIFVRNPYSKILSAYMYLKVRLEKDNNTIRGLKENPEFFTDFPTFVSNYKKVNNISFFHAFIPQYQHILDFSMNNVFQYIGKTENLYNELINIVSLLGIKDLNNINTFFHGIKVNESNYEKDIAEYFDEKSFYFVNEFFKEDFEAFHYKKYDTFDEFKENYSKDEIKYQTPKEIIKKMLNNSESISVIKKTNIPDHYIKIPSKIEKQFSPETFQLIPRNIIQTCKDNYLHPKIYENILSILKKNPTYDYYFINDADGEKLIEDHFDKKTLHAFKRLNVGAAKGDFIRMIALYLYGGVYLDLDASINMNLNSFIPPTNEYIFFYEGDKCQITNWCMMIIPQHIIIKKIIDEMVNRIYENKDVNILLVTGPYLITDVIYNHFTSLNIYNSYYNLDTNNFLEFIVTNNKPPIFFETYFLCLKANLFSFNIDGYNKNMIYYNENEYDIIDNFNIYVPEIKNSYEISNMYENLNNIKYIYLNFIRKREKHNIIEIFSDITNILIEEILNMDINKYNYKNYIMNIKHEKKLLFEKYKNQAKVNNILIDILINSQSELIKQELLLNIKKCDKCNFNCYNNTSYIAHTYFCQ